MCRYDYVDRVNGVTTDLIVFVVTDPDEFASALSASHETPRSVRVNGALAHTAAYYESRGSGNSFLVVETAAGTTVSGGEFLRFADASALVDAQYSEPMESNGTPTA